MEAVLVGLNHKTAPIDVRERVGFPAAALPRALERLREDVGAEEGLILSTCNRVEVLGVLADPANPAERLQGFLARFHDLSPTSLNGHLYKLQGDDLIRHFFRVAASLDSMVVGEAQILGQLKEAFQQSEQAGMAGSFLRRLMHHALFAAKRVRNETFVGRSSVSVSSVAVELAVKIFGELRGRTVLLLGAGKMAELAARGLLKAGAQRLRVVNRTRQRAEQLAAKFGAEVGDLLHLEQELASADVVICSTGASGYVIDPPMMERVVRKRRFDPMFLIDIAVPRNIDPAVNEIETAFLYDIDDLQSVVESNLEERRQEAALAEQIIEEELRNFRLCARTQELGPIIGGLRRRLEELCLEELQRESARFSPEERAVLERMFRRAAHRVAHPLIVKMKESCRDPLPNVDPLEFLAEAFRLPKEGKGD
ncbi:MAG: glutamyl-tRNA reductase [Acidobacteriota bacterium]